MFEWVLSVKFAASSLLQVHFYQCNDSEMGIHCCDVNYKDSGSLTFAQKSRKSENSDPTKHFPLRLRSETQKLPETECFEGSILRVPL